MVSDLILVTLHFTSMKNSEADQSNLSLSNTSLGYNPENTSSPWSALRSTLHIHIHAHIQTHAFLSFPILIRLQRVGW